MRSELDSHLGLHVGDLEPNLNIIAKLRDVNTYPTTPSCDWVEFNAEYSWFEFEFSFSGVKD